MFNEKFQPTRPTFCISPTEPSLDLLRKFSSVVELVLEHQWHSHIPQSFHLPSWLGIPHRQLAGMCVHNLAFIGQDKHWHWELMERIELHGKYLQNGYARWYPHCFRSASCQDKTPLEVCNPRLVYFQFNFESLNILLPIRGELFRPASNLGSCIIRVPGSIP